MQQFNPHEPSIVIVLRPEGIFSGYLTNIEINTNAESPFSNVKMVLSGCEHPETTSTIKLARTAIANLIGAAERLDDEDSIEALRGILVALDL